MERQNAGFPWRFLLDVMDGGDDVIDGVTTALTGCRRMSFSRYWGASRLVLNVAFVFRVLERKQKTSALLFPDMRECMDRKQKNTTGQPVSVESATTRYTMARKKSFSVYG